MVENSLSVNPKKCPSWVRILIAGLYFGWFFFITYSDWPAEVFSRYIPSWFATVVLASCFVLLPPIVLGPLNIPEYLQVSLAVLFLISFFLLLPIAAHFHPVTSTFVGVLSWIESYWLVPRWKTKWDSDLKHGS